MKTKLPSTPTRRRRSLTPKKWTRLGCYYVTGLMHHDYRAELTARGQKVKLVHERSNPFDRFAVAVWIKQDRWRKVGYIQRGKTDSLHDAKARGCAFYAMVNQHDLGNNTDTRMTVVVKVAPYDVPPLDEVEM